MAVLQMTRAEYEKKYGVAPKVDTTPAIPKMTRAEYEMKYGLTTPTEPTTTKIGMLNIDKTKNPFTVSNPLTDIQAAGEDVNAAITGTGKYEGQGAIRRGTSAAATAAMAIPTVVADVIPGGKTAFDLIGKGFEGAINTAGNIHNFLADAAEKVGVMSPEQRKLYDKRNTDFVNSPEGVAIESVASVAKNLGDVSNVILMAAATARGVQNFVDKKLPEIKQKMAEKPPPSPSAQASMDTQRANLVQQQANEISAIESRYAKGRKANLYSKDEGTSSRARIAETGVLKNAVDENGMVRTTHQGGAVDQYKAMTTKPAEGVVRANLVREGNRVNLSEVQSELTNQINNSGLQGADLVNALNGVRKEIAGLRLRADNLGYVDATLLHDAKINTTNNINYQTPPETATYRKAVARGYRTLVENNSSFDVKGINAELAKYYDDIARLERLDGARVQGGRLGKYTAQITGTIAGGAIGGLFGGLGGAAIGTIVGGEVAGLIKGQAMTRAITEVPGKAPVSPILEKAVTEGNQPKSEGSRNLSQSTKSITPKTSITKDTTTIPPEMQPLAAEARKYKSAEEFVKAQVERAKAEVKTSGGDYSGQPESFITLQIAKQNNLPLDTTPGATKVGTKALTDFYNKVMKK